MGHEVVRGCHKQRWSMDQNCVCVFMCVYVCVCHFDERG